MSEFDPTVEYREVQEYLGYRFGSDGSIWTERVTGPRNKGKPRLTGKCAQKRKATMKILPWHG